MYICHRILVSINVNVKYLPTCFSLLQKRKKREKEHVNVKKSHLLLTPVV